MSDARPADFPPITVPAPTPEITGRARRARGGLGVEHALTGAEVDAALQTGRALADAEVDTGSGLLLVGHIGVAGRTPAAVLVAALTGAEPVAVVGQDGDMGGDI